ncbi:sec-independent protein translocase protein TATB, chloroplastic-like isoform X3 [Oryza brachyantha]|uniref:sec-independent protein translocase protein TATB, chloroplastic-like isoform X3 n=1 Tax=Oryza brachyantha TaxID=4533 RepID=UPI001ADD4822|nr:sec-independent protein translocase protein TATB, chloroplastic-like isoform X3 [Oryza brachyantha]
MATTATAPAAASRLAVAGARPPAHHHPPTTVVVSSADARPKPRSVAAAAASPAAGGVSPVLPQSKRRSRGTGVYASLFGVGASEALVIGVVALLFFGPKVAEVARNLGKTLRAFQPTIRELQDVSREFKSTLGQEIGLDEVPPSTNYRL